jgi:DNA mismatch repair protein MutL
MTIHILPPEVAAKIAAGEVVERPANVAKELVENSLDAGATEIRVEVRDGGRRLLRVSDNGHGIPAAEAPLAFERHATSKLLTVEDLEHIGTFGFRGEALYSIAAVSQLTLTTRARTEEFATTLRLDGGVIQSQGRAGAPVGTVVNVENLFFNVPARQKFLRAGAGEAGQIADVVQHYALAHPERRFSFVSEGRLLFQSNGTGDRFDVLVKIYGLENARQMVPFGASALLSRETPPEPDDLPPEIDFMADVTAVDTATRTTQPSGLSLQGRSHVTLAVSGHASLPSLTRPNRSAIDLFVNRRYVEDRTLTHAVVQAYYTLLPGGRYPVAVVFVDIDPAEVDVNVHPQKLQVRFAAERKVFSEVQKAVRRAIVGAAPVPDLGVDEEGRLAPAPAAPDTRPETSAWSARRDLIVNAGQQQHTFEMYVPGNAERGMQNAERGGSGEQRVTSDKSSDTTDTEHAPRTTEHAPSSSPLAPRPSALPPLRVVGQIGAMYIVAEGPDGVFLIDQHAAHERVLYEKFLGQRYGTADGAVAQQHLLDPITLHVGTRLAGLVADHLAALQHVGFAVEAFGGDTFLVRAVPSVLAGEDPQRALEEIVSTFNDRRNQVGEELEERLVKMVCKRAAIKAGQLLSDLEMQELVRQLETCQSPRTCPHGRPTMIQLSAGELEKAFGRV